MQRRRKKTLFQNRSAPAGLDKRHGVRPTDILLDSNATIELNEVCATAEQHMLAVVDDFAGTGMLIRRRATTQVRTPLKQGHAETGSGKGASSGQSSQTAS